MGNARPAAVRASMHEDARRSTSSAPGRWSATLASPRRVHEPSRYAVLRRLLAIADVAGALIATVGAALVTAQNSSDLIWALLFLPAWILIAKLLGLYHRDEAVLRHLTVDELPSLVLWAIVGTVGLALFLDLTPAGRLHASSAITVAAIAVVAVTLLRGAVRFFWRLMTPPEAIALIGSPECIDRFKRKLELFPDLHMQVVAEWRHAGSGIADAEWPDSVEHVVVAPASLDDPTLEDLFDASRRTGVLLTLLAPASSAFAHAARLSHLAELSVLNYGQVDLARSTLFLKRVLDIIVAALGLVLLAPVLAVAALAVKLDSRGSVVFTQWRAGQGGRPFRMYKLRTMVENAEELLPRLVLIDDLQEPVFKIEHDPRVTRAGRMLRRWSLDELPQLWNVLKGEMSLVGPRPEELALVERYSPKQRRRLLVQPGMTGPMQVYGRGALDFDERLAVEIDYIENLSLGRDLKMIGMTLAAVVRGEGAY